MWLQQKQHDLSFFSTDACLKGAGGIYQGQYFHVEFPKEVFMLDENVHIAHLELLAIIVGVRLWADLVHGKRFTIACDNEAVVTIINSGRSRNCLLQQMLRELAFCLANLDTEIHATYISSGANLMSDLLSRWSLHDKYQDQFNQLKQQNWEERIVSDQMFKLSSNW